MIHYSFGFPKILTLQVESLTSIQNYSKHFTFNLTRANNKFESKVMANYRAIK